MDLADRYRAVRARTLALSSMLGPEDMQVQSMRDASPTKWHLAHTTWFFEAFVLGPSKWGALFNSYYEAIGVEHPRAARGVLSRPTLEEVLAQRARVDEAIVARLADADAETRARIELGTHHEEQHQELILTDVLHAFAQNPLRPAYRSRAIDREHRSAPPLRFVAIEGGLVAIGHDPARGFAFDNESPRHRVHLEPFAIASRAVTCGEVIAFVEDGGYERPALWLSDGWSAVRARGWRAPLYWEERDGAWWTMTLDGMREVDRDAPACHVSGYEADAIARWLGARLPTEAEWEHATRALKIEGNLLDDPRASPLAPIAARGDAGILQAFGDVWEWTASPYVAYPGYRPPSGALGEYNGKFMCNQMVLRGGSCLTPRDHARATYRNFFPPDARWQMSGLRVARDA